MFIKVESLRFSRYALSAALTFVVDLAAFNFFFSMGIGILTSHVLSVFIAVVFSFFMLSKYVFSGLVEFSLPRRVLSFVIVNALALVFSSFILAFIEALVEVGDDTIVANSAKVLSIGLVAVLKFFAYRIFTFVG